MLFHFGIQSNTLGCSSVAKQTVATQQLLPHLVQRVWRSSRKGAQLLHPSANKAPRVATMCSERYQETEDGREAFEVGGLFMAVG
jgi:hypothetical protein